MNLFEWFTRNKPPVQAGLPGVHDFYQQVVAKHVPVMLANASEVTCDFLEGVINEVNVRLYEAVMAGKTPSDELKGGLLCLQAMIQAARELRDSLTRELQKEEK